MVSEIRSLKDQTIAVIGASSGIGRATARALVVAGANVVLGARRADRLAELKAELGEHAHPVTVDVTRPEDMAKLIAEGASQFGGVDSVVLAAGIGMYGGIEDHSDADVTKMVDINLLGTIWAVRAALPELRRRNGGDIVIIASVAGLSGGSNEAAYAATKFGQIGLATSLDRQLRLEGIRVSVLAPAGTSTEFAMGAGRNEGDPNLRTFLQADDIALEVVTVLQQPRRMRTTLWASWSMAEGN
jgi:NADP-dependent 3-hydroxy acid dehydrogenase YdfG